MSPPPPQSPSRTRPRPLPAATILLALLVASVLGACGADDPSPGGSGADTGRRAYVDKDSVGGRCSDGRDARAAASASTPWCTLAHAAQEAPAGTTLLLRRGSYPRLALDGVRHDEFVTVAAAEGETVTLAGFEVRDTSHVRFRGLRFRGRSNLIDVGSDHIEVLDSDLTLATLVKPSTNLRFEGNTIHDLPGPPGANVDGVGIWMATGGATSPISDVVIRDNRFSRLPNDAIYTDGERILIEHNVFEEIRSPDNDWTHADVVQSQGADDLTIRGNFARDNDSGILNTDARVHGWTIENNVFVRSESQPLQLDNQLDDLRLVNNTFWDGGPVYLRWDDRFPRNTKGFVVVNNIVTRLDVDPRLNIAVDDWNLIGEDPFGSPVAPHSRVGVVPEFRDRSRDDYSLLATSPGVDRGTSDFDAPRTDRDGEARYDVPRAANSGPKAFVDVGAYETTPKRADRSVPRLRVSLDRGAEDAVVGLNVRCSSDCRVTATGSVRLTGAGSAERLERAAFRARAGRSFPLRLRLGPSRVRARSAAPGGRRPRARVRVTARFRTGVPAVQTIHVPLRR